MIRKSSLRSDADVRPEGFMCDIRQQPLAHSPQRELQCRLLGQCGVVLLAMLLARLYHYSPSKLEAPTQQAIARFLTIIPLNPAEAQPAEPLQFDPFSPRLPCRRVLVHIPNLRQTPVHSSHQQLFGTNDLKKWLPVAASGLSPQ